MVLAPGDLQRREVVDAIKSAEGGVGPGQSQGEEMKWRIFSTSLARSQASLGLG